MLEVGRERNLKAGVCSHPQVRLWHEGSGVVLRRNRARESLRTISINAGGQQFCACIVSPASCRVWHSRLSAEGTPSFLIRSTCERYCLVLRNRAQ